MIRNNRLNKCWILEFKLNDAANALLACGARPIMADDLLYQSNEYKWFIGERIDNQNTHGTGCTLSGAIASGLVKGLDLETSVQVAKEYISGALKAMIDLGKGYGPLNHAWNITETPSASKTSERK